MGAVSFPFLKLEKYGSPGMPFVLMNQLPSATKVLYILAFFPATARPFIG